MTLSEQLQQDWRNCRERLEEIERSWNDERATTIRERYFVPLRDNYGQVYTIFQSIDVYTEESKNKFKLLEDIMQKIEDNRYDLVSALDQLEVLVKQTLAEVDIAQDSAAEAAGLTEHAQDILQQTQSIELV